MINKYRGMRKCLYTILSNDQTLFRYNVHYSIILQSHKPGITCLRHIYKREYDVIGNDIKWHLINAVKQTGIKFVRASYFMCTDFKRNPDRIMHVTLNIPNYYSNLGLSWKLDDSLKKQKFVKGVRSTGYDPRYLPYTFDKVVTYVCD